MIAPVIYFTDIITGADTGGENNNGVYLTIYGKGFGATRGTSTVTIGGAAPAQYKIWGSGNSVNTLLDMIVVQIGSAALTGNVVVTVSGVTSNGVPFTVCSGNIYFVSPSGNDSNPGSFASPWLTPGKARSAMVAGDTVYFRAGTYNTVDNFGAPMLIIGNSGTSGAYQNFLGYPGETAQLGDSSVSRAIYFWGNTTLQYVAIGQLKIRSSASSLSFQNVIAPGGCNHIRVVGNDAQTSGTGEGVDFEMPADNIVIYGNESGNNCPSGCNFDNRAYSVYFGGYGAQSNVDIGWNRLHDNLFGKSLQLYGHQAGDTMTNFFFHDNLCYNNSMPGMTLGGGDPGVTGDVNVTNAQIYNNVFWNNAYGSRFAQGSIQLQTYNTLSGTYKFYNNSFYNDGVNHGNSLPSTIIEYDNLGVSSSAFYNNVFYAPSSATTFFQSTASFSGGHNVYFGIASSNIPAADTTSIFGDPKFSNPAGIDLHLGAGSPAIAAGQASNASVRDFDGDIRPSPPSIGAFDVTGGPQTSVVGVGIIPVGIIFLAKGSQQQFTATVTGTPNTAVTWSADAPNGLFTASAIGNFTVTATSVADPTKSASATVTITQGASMSSSVSVDFVVMPAPPVINPVNLPPLVVGQPFTFAFSASGCAAPSCVWSIASGSLPLGLGFTSAGVVSGTPTTAGSFVVVFSVV